MITCWLSGSCGQDLEEREAWEGKEGSGGRPGCLGELLKAGRRHSVAARQCALVKGNGDGRARTRPHTAHCTLQAARCTRDRH